MNQTIDAVLERLAQSPVPEGLAAIEGQVLSRITGEGPGSARARSLRYAAGGLALALGIVVGALPSDADYRAPAALTPLDGSSALAPSTLLLSGE